MTGENVLAFLEVTEELRAERDYKADFKEARSRLNEDITKSFVLLNFTEDLTIDGKSHGCFTNSMIAACIESLLELLLSDESKEEVIAVIAVAVKAHLAKVEENKT